VEVISQTGFAEPSDISLLDRLDDEPLVVHQKPGVTDNRALIIFVHGLGGRRYGKKLTWGQFPKFVYEDFPQLDVGLYEYRTLFRRAKFWESVPLPDEARVFARIIRDVKDYKTIILMGHSMGGLLCMAAICHLIDTNQKEVLSRIDGLILMTTPQTGSQRVPAPLSWFSRDFYALKPHGEFVTRLHETLVNHVILDESHAKPDKIVIPTWAVLGASDFWVDKLSAGLQLPDRRKKMVRGSHTAVVKPQSKQSDAYLFVHDCLKACLGRLGTRHESPPSSQSGITLSQTGAVQIGRDAQGNVVIAGDNNQLFVLLGVTALPQEQLTQLTSGKLEPQDIPEAIPLPTLTLRIASAPEPGTWTLTAERPGLESCSRMVPVPWQAEPQFASALGGFWKLTQRAIENEAEHQAINAHALILGEALSTVLSPDDRGLLITAARYGGSPPLLVIESSGDLVLALPWELLRLEGHYAVREGRLDIARSVPAEGAPHLEKPTMPVSLLLNVSAPEGSGLDYEAESYYILRALHDHVGASSARWVR
jgi:pimeloyl-ACP methyl ester carboxylesterase